MIYHGACIAFFEVEGRKFLSFQQVAEDSRVAAFVRDFWDCFEFDPIWQQRFYLREGPTRLP